jgi:uncharacterized repeat protein (TIGR03803 family)
MFVGKRRIIMTRKEQERIGDSATSLGAAALRLTIVFVLMVVTSQAAQAQSFQVIHTFTNGPDGEYPLAGLTLDRAGNLYGTTAGNYIVSYGTVYQLRPKGTGWVLSTLYTFTGAPDGGEPRARVVFGPGGLLYGTTFGGGNSACGSGGCGTVFKVRPPLRACTTSLCPWTETVLYAFKGFPDAAFPEYPDLIFDQAGNIYGTTTLGGSNQCSGSGCGTAFRLTPSGSGWTESVIYNFGTGSSDGAVPFAGVIFDNAGNLYGTTFGGGTGSGTVFRLTPPGNGWTEKILYNFQGNDGDFPYAGLIFDQSGNLYGATSDGGTGGGGTVFELSPSGGSWTLTVLYSFTGTQGCGPFANLVMDAAGNLDGTTYCDGAYGFGSVFKLTPTPTPPWTYTPLHDFTGGSDGKWPVSNVTLDMSGNLYGTASQGGTHFGVVWKITP